MSGHTDYAIGSPVSTRDGDCGKLSRIVIDPVARALTHLVVQPRVWSGIGRLVPIELVDATAEGISLRCSRAEFDALEEAEETDFLPEADGAQAYGEGGAWVWPYYGLGSLDSGAGSAVMAGIPTVVTHDRVPVGEVEIRRGEHVHATDGIIGRVQGLVIDPNDHHVTHVLLEEGHLWGRGSSPSRSAL